MQALPSYRLAFSQQSFKPGSSHFSGGRIAAERWTDDCWRATPPLKLAHFRPEGSAHRPETLCRLSYDRDGINGLFRVDDRYVRAVHAGYQAPVYRDSCVEFFVQPEDAQGYFNFEFNCGGAMLASYVTDPTRVEGGVRGFVPLSRDDCDRVARFHSLPASIDPEIAGPVVWLLEFRIPFAVLEPYAGPVGEVGGRSWRANLFKCGNDTSHPHWASWSPLDALNFHAPWNFGRIVFSQTGPK